MVVAMTLGALGAGQTNRICEVGYVIYEDRALARITPVPSTGRLRERGLADLRVEDVRDG